MVVGGFALAQLSREADLWSRCITLVATTFAATSVWKHEGHRGERWRARVRIDKVHRWTHSRMKVPMLPWGLRLAAVLGVWGHIQIQHKIPDDVHSPRDGTLVMLRATKCLERFRKRKIRLYGAR